MFHHYSESKPGQKSTVYQLINKLNSNITLLRWNNTVQLVKNSHVTWNIQSESIIPASNAKI